MVSMVCNTDVKQKDAAHSVIVGVSSHAIFDSEAEHIPVTTEPFLKGPAFSFIKAVQQVNERLLEKNPAETLLLDVILLSNDREENHARIIASVKHYGLDIGRFCFCNKEENIESLQSSRVKLFLSADKDDVFKALQQGVPSALLYSHPDHQTSDQLKVVFSADALGFADDSLACKEQGFTETQLQGFRAAKDCMKEFALLMGEMRSRFGVEGGPLCTSLMSVWGSRDVCARALKLLRGWGLMVDEAFCLAGAPLSPILNLVQPHILCIDALHHTPRAITQS